MPRDPRTPSPGGPKRAARPEAVKVLTPREVFTHLDRFVIGQDAAKRALAIAAHQHLQRVEQRRRGTKELLRKSNVLLVGPTGSGKTHLARNLASLLEVPFTVVDATEYTEAGYYGKDVEVMIAELLFKSGHSIDATERGIVFIDEIDKLARRGSSARTGAGSRDIGGEGVQQALLKLLEGRELFVPLNVTQHWNKHDFVQVDTSDILFVCAGTFSDLHGAREDKVAGFGATQKGKLQRIRTQELLEYGMLAELLGRLPVHVQLAELSEADLVRILKEPPDSLVREYEQRLALSDVELRFDDAALAAIAHHAVERRLGARGLRSLFEEVLADVLFEAPEKRGETVRIDAKWIRTRLERY